VELLECSVSKDDKVSEPFMVTFPKQTAIFEWCVVQCGRKNGHQKGIRCLKEIELHAQNMITILGSRESST